MIAIGVLIFVLGVVALVGLALFLGSWARDEARLEARLHEPGAHTLAYVVPNGQDPAVLMAALAGAGFTAIVDLYGGRERLLVECGEDDRARVREVIEHVDRGGIDGPEMHVGHVSFEDER